MRYRDRLNEAVEGCSSMSQCRELVVLLVSKEIKEALEHIGATGTKFKEV
jgi:hypothetical protein